MKIANVLSFLLFSVFCNPAVSGDMVRVDSKTFRGCEGEGCGCTRDKKSTQGFKLYKKMDKKSKFIGNFKKGTKAQLVSPYTILLKPGTATVTEVSDASLAAGLKVNDVLSPFFYEGEGNMRGMLNHKWILFDQSSVKLKTTQEQKTQNWFEIKVGAKQGFSPTFPFTSCQE